MPVKHMPAKKVARREVGWREWVALPDLGIERIKAKVDTGARTAALHAKNIKAFTHHGESWLKFDAYPRQKDRKVVVACKARLIGHRKVRNSGGQTEDRYLIETDLVVGALRWPVEITLTNRTQMGFRMLLGRTTIARRFVVDPARSFLTGDPRAL